MFYLETKSSKRELGFTLVELSVVIVIIGLIVAGVVGGQSLVKQSQLRAVLSEYNQYDAAINAFKLEYNALPGDMSNAYDYWGANCAASSAQCNGTGNGRVYYIDSSRENFMVWKHLALAGIISGSFTGVADVGGLFDMTPSVNVPASKFSKGGWMLDSNPFWATNVDSLIGTKHRLSIGGESYLAPSHVFNVIFTPTQAKSIDAKIDDEIPFKGRVQGVVGFTGGALLTNCTSGAGASSTYLLTETIERCQMLFDLSATGKKY